MREMILGSILWSSVIGGVVQAGLAVIARWDKPLPGEKKLLAICLSAFMQGAFVQYLFGGERRLELFLWSLIGGCLLLADITDVAVRRVYNFVWWVALAAGGTLFGMSVAERMADGIPARNELCILIQLMLFFLLQFGVFGRTYGKADCYAFCVCAVAMASRGMTMAGYLMHMILAYLFLILVQMRKGNISRRGCLKNPVPFLPYISISFWMTILWYN